MKQAVAHVVDCYAEAKFSVYQAQQYARAAEDMAERIDTKMQQLQSLCETYFDPEAMKHITDMIKGAAAAVAQDE